MKREKAAEEVRKVRLRVLEERLHRNRFALMVRIGEGVSRTEYEALTQILQDLRVALGDDSVIDREMAMVLFELPTIVRNAYLALQGTEDGAFLEDAWVELDALVMGVFSGRLDPHGPQPRE